MCNLQHMLYKSALKLTRNMPSEHQCRIALCYNPRTDQCCYNLPTVTEEIAVVIPGAGDEFSNSHDIILHHREGEPLKQISELHPFYPALHYVLLFPKSREMTILACASFWPIVGKKVFISRITLTPLPSQIPFNLERKQFPLKICLQWPSTSHKANLLNMLVLTWSLWFSHMVNFISLFQESNLLTISKLYGMKI